MLHEVKIINRGTQPLDVVAGGEVVKQLDGGGRALLLNTDSEITLRPSKANEPNKSPEAQS